MIDKFIKRENQIFEVLRNFGYEDLEYVLVGGYAVSAFQHRFSVDADLVIRNGDLANFEEILESEDFERIREKDLDTVYGGKFLAYRKKAELPVTIDLLMNSLKCRQTGASWSYEYIKKYSTGVEIEGSEKSLKAKIPEKELLIAIKLHAGRLADARDVVALASNIDFEKMQNHLERGNKTKLEDVLKKVSITIESEDFKDSFKGVFTEERVSEENIKSVKSFIREKIRQIS